MQTFLPYPSFAESAQVLDYKRLGKQRLEAKQLYDIITQGKVGGYANHPACTMWRDCPNALASYYNEICYEWIARGYNHSMPLLINDVDVPEMPWWFGDYEFHLSHRSNLLRKDAIFYGKLWQGTPADLPYIWPAQKRP